MSDFRINGLDTLIQDMNRESRNRSRYDDLRYDVGRRHLHNCAEHCGEDSGQLVASFRRQPFNGKKEWVLNGRYADSIEAGTSVFYARMLNDGHRLVLRRRNSKGVPIKGKRGLKEVGFVSGTHFMERALDQTQEDLPELVRDFLRETGKAAGFDVSG
ncbi:hypothetical protein [Gorillibacterium sp. sgz5001074]|uniref:hypothetical protein n=1 Tax=Gorillibacterium sp. sgz5001074 TaxID=3446695 RepID=UPI003F67ED31